MYNPVLQLVIGDYTFDKCAAFEMTSSATNDIDYGIVELSKAYIGKVSVNKNDVVTVSAGYGNEITDIFSGVIADIENPCRFIIADNAILLARTKITNTFTYVTPQELIRYCLSIAGITNYVLSETAYEQKESVSICGMNVIDVLKIINSLWNIDISYGFVLGVFYWGTLPEQTDIYVLEYGANIITLEDNVVTTYLLPHLQQAQIIEINHPNISGLFSVTQVQFKFDDDGFARTIITFRGSDDV